jgi:excisionase family DNA binding protein
VSTESHPPHDALDQIMKVAEVASLLSLPRSTVSDYARREILPSFKLGRHRRFLRSDVLAKVEQLRQPGNAEA